MAVSQPSTWLGLIEGEHRLPRVAANQRAAADGAAACGCGVVDCHHCVLVDLLLLLPFVHLHLVDEREEGRVGARALGRAHTAQQMVNYPRRTARVEAQAAAAPPARVLHILLISDLDALPRWILAQDRRRWLAARRLRMLQARRAHSHQAERILCRRGCRSRRDRHSCSRGPGEGRGGRRRRRRWRRHQRRRCRRQSRIQCIWGG